MTIARREWMLHGGKTWRIEQYWRAYERDSASRRDVFPVGSHPSRFDVIRHFVGLIAEDGGEFTSARLNDWLITNYPHYAMSIASVAGLLRRKKDRLGVEVCYRDGRHGHDLAVWKVKGGPV